MTRKPIYLRCIAATLLAMGSAVPAARARTICTAMADAATGAVVMRKGNCQTRVTPASTFKIAISLMGYDRGFLKDEHVPALPFRAGYPDWLPEWRRTTDPTRWIEYSVVWFSQQVTQALGEARFRRYVDEFQYGNRDVSGDPGRHDGLTRAWLSSSLKISPLEQLTFLESLVERRLPVTPHALEMTARITQVAVLPNGWDIHGKTGTGSPGLANGADEQAQAYGWFVGWATKGPRAFVFARLIQVDQREPVRAGIQARSAFLRELPALLDALPGR